MRASLFSFSRVYVDTLCYVTYMCMCVCVCVCRLQFVRARCVSTTRTHICECVYACVNLESTFIDPVIARRIRRQKNGENR